MSDITAHLIGPRRVSPGQTVGYDVRVRGTEPDRTDSFSLEVTGLFVPGRLPEREYGSGELFLTEDTDEPGLFEFTIPDPDNPDPSLVGDPGSLIPHLDVEQLRAVKYQPEFTVTGTYSERGRGNVSRYTDQQTVRLVPSRVPTPNATY